MLSQFFELYVAYAAYLEKIIDAGVGATAHDLLRQRRADAWEGNQFFQRGRVDVDFP